MTIYTSKTVEKKEESGVPPPEVISDSVLLLDDEKGGDQPNAVRPVIVTAVLPKKTKHGSVRGSRFSTLHVCAALIILPLGLSLLTGCIWLYKHLNEGEIHYIGRCGVDFHQYGHLDPLMPHASKFSQQLEIGNQFEKIEMPALGNARQSITLHDFNMNATAIIDDEAGTCFLVPLNRTLVKPPKNLWDLIQKLGDGHFVMDAQLLQARYKVVLPALDHEQLKLYGPHIEQECRFRNTYKLSLDDKTRGLKKRSSCPFSGLKYCEGAAGVGSLLCVTLTSCL